MTLADRPLLPHPRRPGHRTAQTAQDLVRHRRCSPDWVLIGALLVAVLTGFATEVLHYVRLEPHRHLAYFVHLVSVGALFLYLPYTKLAHVLYRTTALVGAEYYGRTRTSAPPLGARPVDPAGTNHP